ncbi:MAG: hypothetical protein L0H96_21885 [Humibacillus sp.]|nr:hypothetical protein [Humibacillus sp.]MDN5779547.1 hypothetical protein [Humibacillus sp.]
MGGDGSYTIGPGFWGFVAFFVMAIALWLLVRNMSGRLRRMAYQERQREGAVTSPKQAATGEGADRPAPSGPLDLSSPGRVGGSPDDAGSRDRSGDADEVSPDDTPRDEAT